MSEGGREGGREETELKAAILARELDTSLPFVAVIHATLHLISSAGAGGKTRARSEDEGGTYNLAKGETANYGPKVGSSPRPEEEEVGREGARQCSKIDPGINIGSKQQPRRAGAAPRARTRSETEAERS